MGGSSRLKIQWEYLCPPLGYSNLQPAQEITATVSEAEAVVDEATKFCDAIKAQHSIQPKKSALSSGKPATPVPPMAASLTREIQTSVVWTQSVLQLCATADNASEVRAGANVNSMRAQHPAQ